MSGSTGEPRPIGPAAWFYLAAVLILVAVFALIAAGVAWPLAAFVFTFALLALLVVGALQLRNDDRLAEENFLRLIGMVIRGMPKELPQPGARRADATSSPGAADAQPPDADAGGPQ